jgi:hypothetical protein
VFFFHGENLFEHSPCRRVTVTQPRDDFGVGGNRNPFGHEVFADHGL